MDVYKALLAVGLFATYSGALCGSTISNFLMLVEEGNMDFVWRQGEMFGNQRVFGDKILIGPGGVGITVITDVYVWVTSTMIPIFMTVGGGFSVDGLADSYSIDSTTPLPVLGDNPPLEDVLHLRFGLNDATWLHERVSAGFPRRLYVIPWWSGGASLEGSASIHARYVQTSTITGGNPQLYVQLIPEPATIFLMGCGLALTFAAIGRKRWT